MDPMQQHDVDLEPEEPDLSGMEIEGGGVIMSENDAQVWLDIHGGFEAPRKHYATLPKSAAEALETVFVELTRQRRGKSAGYLFDPSNDPPEVEP